MSITLANLNSVQKDRFASFVTEKLDKSLSFLNSGAAIRVTPQEMGLSYIEGMRVATLPFWKTQSFTHVDLIDTNTQTTAQAIEAGAQTARILYRGNGWGKSWLAQHLVGDDPLKNIGQLIAEYWSNNYHTAILNVLAGMFDTPGDTGLTDRYVDSTSKGLVTGNILRQGIYKMGQSFNKIKIMLVHPDVYSLLDTNQDVIMVPDETGLALYPVLRGTNIKIYVDSTIPRHNLSVPNDVGANNSSVYFLGEGAFLVCDLDDYYGYDQDKTRGTTAIHNRKAVIIHPNGMEWKSADPSNAAGQTLTPTNANLANKLNWDRVYNVSNIAIVRQDVAVSV